LSQLTELKSERSDLQKRVDTLDKEARKIRERVREIDEEILILDSPFLVGDIVIDDNGVRYRVTRLGSRPSGIRLSTSGIEAHKDSRTIWSNSLRKVT
jgi:hypothetical protein